MRPGSIAAGLEMNPAQGDALHSQSVYWVLVVDDRAAKRFAVSKSLANVHALEVIECENADQALELLTQLDFSLVLLDAEMAGLMAMSWRVLSPPLFFGPCLS